MDTRFSALVGQPFLYTDDAPSTQYLLKWDVSLDVLFELSHTALVRAADQATTYAED